MFAFCIEASHARGLGHLYRSLNLADRLRLTGRHCIFFVNDDDFSLKTIHRRGYAAEVVSLVDEASSWERDLVVRHRISLWVDDRLNTSGVHGERVRSLGIPLVTFDDRGAGAAFANLHVAALSGDDARELAGAWVLRGPEYLILNPELEKFRRLREPGASRLLVTLGGSDTYGVTVQVISILARTGRLATVLVGPAFDHDAALAGALSCDPGIFNVVRNVPSLAELMFQHDLAITGGGITPFEAAASGLPTIVIANEAFEVPVAQLLAKIGCSVFAGYHSELDESVFSSDLDIAKMSQAGLDGVTLDGAAKVAAELLAL